MFHRNLFGNELLLVDVIIDVIESTNNVIWTLGNHDISEYLFHTKYFQTCSDNHLFVFGKNERVMLNKFCKFVQNKGIVAWYDSKNDIVASHTVFKKDMLPRNNNIEVQIKQLNSMFKQFIINDFNNSAVKEHSVLFGWERITSESDPNDYLFEDTTKAIGHTIYKLFYSDIEYNAKLSNFKIMDCDFGCIDSMYIEIAKFYIISDTEIKHHDLINVKSLCNKFDYYYMSKPIELIKF